MPVHSRNWDDVLETLQASHNKGPVRPWAGVGDIEVVPVLLGWEDAALLDEIPELGLASLEFACLVARSNKVCDLGSRL